MAADPVVTTLFDRSGKALPRHISATLSILIGTICSLIVFYNASKPILKDKKDNEESEDILKQYRWVVMLGVLLYVGNMTYSFVQEKIYLLQSVRYNSQHIANCFWLKKYKNSIM